MPYHVELSRLSCAVHLKIDRKQKNKPNQGRPAGTQSGGKAFFECARAEWPIPPAAKMFGLYALLLKNPAKYDFATKLALLGRIPGGP